MNKICVTPRASLGFHQAYYDKAFTFGIKVTSLEGTSDLMSYYPSTVKDWIRRNGGLTTEMKKIKNGEDLWKIVEAATKGPSGSNAQPVRWIVVTDPDKRAQLGAIYKKAWAVIAGNLRGVRA